MRSRVRCTMRIPGHGLLRGARRYTLQYDAPAVNLCFSSLPLSLTDGTAHSLLLSGYAIICVTSHYPIPRASLSHTQCSRDDSIVFAVPCMEPVPGNGKVLLFMGTSQWFVHHPLAAATLLYAAAVCSVLIYAFFEARDHTCSIGKVESQHQPTPFDEEPS